VVLDASVGGLKAAFAAALGCGAGLRPVNALAVVDAANKMFDAALDANTEGLDAALDASIGGLKAAFDAALGWRGPAAGERSRRRRRCEDECIAGDQSRGARGGGSWARAKRPAYIPTRSFRCRANRALRS
jgi:hypothetical protein